jgi:hypothetical protein
MSSPEAKRQLLQIARAYVQLAKLAGHKNNCRGLFSAPPHVFLISPLRKFSSEARNAKLTRTFSCDTGGTASAIQAT